MMTDQEFVARYRRLRNGLGWLILAVWLIYRWTALSAAQAAERAAMKDCDGLVDWVTCGASNAAGSFGFGVSMLLAILVSPFAFLVSSYIARFWAEKEKAESARADQQAQEAQRLRHEGEQRARIERTQDDAARSKRAASRVMLVASLGSVNEFLDLLGTVPADEEALVKQSVGNALRELVAKNTLPEIIALVQDDEAVHLIMGKTIERLHAVAVGSEAVMILEYAYSMRNTAIRP